MDNKKAKQIIGNQPKFAIRSMRKALELLTWHNTPTEWERLEACYTLLKTPHGKRVTKQGKDDGKRN